MSRAKYLLMATITLVLSSALTLAAAELILRLLPVASGLAPMSVTPDHPVFHFTPNRPFVFSRGWDFEGVNKGWVNNDGWVNDADYTAKGSDPVLAVVGDSYIEAIMVPFAQTAQGRLAKQLAGRCRVYSFAASGAPLSQYLIWAQYAVKTYRATNLVINVVGNDFDESHTAYKTAPGFWHYQPDANGALRLRLFEFHRTLAWSLISASATARYFFINLHLSEYVFSLLHLWDVLFPGAAHAAPASRFAGNTAADASPERLRISFQVIDAFFRDLPAMTGLDPGHVAFTVDGFRYPEAAQAGRGSYFEIMRTAFLRKAHELGYEAIDLDPLFFRQGEQTGERFEYPDDAHWNPNGHAVMAAAVFNSRMAKAACE